MEQLAPVIDYCWDSSTVGIDRRRSSSIQQRSRSSIDHFGDNKVLSNPSLFAHSASLEPRTSSSASQSSQALRHLNNWLNQPISDMGPRPTPGQGSLPLTRGFLPLGRYSKISNGEAIAPFCDRGASSLGSLSRATYLIIGPRLDNSLQFFDDQSLWRPSIKRAFAHAPTLDSQDALPRFVDHQQA